jgi:hypothetical protein
MFMILATAGAACSKRSGREATSSPAPASSWTPEAPPVVTEPTPTPTATALMLLRPKSGDDEFQAAIVVLQSADVTTEVATALVNGDHRLFAIRGPVVEAPGVAGDWRTLPKGAYVVTIAGTSAEAGSRYQQRFQLLAHAYAAKYNPLLLSRLQ